MTGRARFAQIVSAGLAAADRLPVAEHARLAHCAGGPPLVELERMIREHRTQVGVPIAA